MGQIHLYIATSLDGFIARENGDLEWLTSLPMPAEGDYGYEALMAATHNIVMGRDTYQHLLNTGIDWPYAQYHTFVFSRNRAYEVSTPATTLVHEITADLVNEWRKHPKDTWLVGGAQVVKHFLAIDGIDFFSLGIAPVMLGSGIPLFASAPHASAWQLMYTRHWETGFVLLEYARKR